QSSPTASLHRGFSFRRAFVSGDSCQGQAAPGLFRSHGQPIRADDSATLAHAGAACPFAGPRWRHHCSFLQGPSASVGGTSGRKIARRWSGLSQGSATGPS
ncbi:unnamed protein product, partial [Symbiodinium pilosum]